MAYEIYGNQMNLVSRKEHAFISMAPDLARPSTSVQADRRTARAKSVASNGIEACLVLAYATAALVEL